MARPDRLAEGRARAAQARAARNSVAPRCTNRVLRPGMAQRPPDGSSKPDRVCGTPTIQNEPERSRGVFWCPRCQSYPWGSGGGRSGGGPDKVPAEAYAP